MSERHLKLIAGYHPETPPPPKEARAHLPFRFAVVLDSYRRGNPDMVFDHSLFLALLRALADALSSDRVQVYVEPLPSRLRRLLAPPPAPLNGLRALSDHYSVQPVAEREPPSLVYFRRGSTMVAVGVSEPWARVGGPEPYHDSYTFSIFSGLSDPARLFSSCTAAARDEGASITDVLQAEPSWHAA